jgi:O-6-methylguanine DNA methyltransferase
MKQKIIESGFKPMINIYHQKYDEMYYFAALEDDEVAATNLGANEGEVLKRLMKHLHHDTPFQIVGEPDQFAEKLLATMMSMFAGKNVSSDFKLKTENLHDYAKRVFAVLAKVPVGYVTTYGALAKSTGLCPRAVGKVMSTNPFVPLIPCHRVVRSDFTLGGYGGGLDTKRKILERENRDYKEESKVNVGCAVLAVYPVGFLWKY